MLKKIFSFVVLGLVTFSVAVAVVNQSETPLCSDNQTTFIALDNATSSPNYGFYACYVKPLSYQLKIHKVSLVKSDGSGVVDILAPSTPTYQDLISGEVNLLKDLNLKSGLYDGTYSGLDIIFDNDILVKAKAQYSGGGLPNSSAGSSATGYCHTLNYLNGRYVDSFAGTYNGAPSRFGDSPNFSDSTGASFISPGVTTFRYVGSPMVGAGITGVDRTYSNYTGTDEGAYWSNVKYSVTGDAATADFTTLDSTLTASRRYTAYDATTNSALRNIYYAKYRFNFNNNLTLNASKSQIISITFDLSKAIGFAWNFTGSGSGTYNSGTSDGTTYGVYGTNSYPVPEQSPSNGYPDCLRMFIGKVDLSLAVSTAVISSR